MANINKQLGSYLDDIQKSHDEFLAGFKIADVGLPSKGGTGQSPTGSYSLQQNLNPISPDVFTQAANEFAVPRNLLMAFGAESPEQAFQTAYQLSSAFKQTGDYSKAVNSLAGDQAPVILSRAKQIHDSEIEQARMDFDALPEKLLPGGVAPITQKTIDDAEKSKKAWLAKATPEEFHKAYEKGLISLEGIPNDSRFLKRSWAQAANDTLFSLAQSSVGLVGLGAGAAAIFQVPGASKMVEATSYARELMEKEKSIPGQIVNQRLSEAAEGEGRTFIENAGDVGKVIVDHPYLLADLAAQNLATLVGGVALSIYTAGSLAALTAYTTLMGGGDGYSSTYEKVKSTPHEELQKRSQKYNEYIADGMSKEEARDELANQAGTQAGFFTGMASFLLSKFGSVALEKSIGDAVSSGAQLSGKQIVANVTKEILTDGGEEMAVQLYGNEAIKALVDPEQDVHQGLGGSFALGAAATAPSSLGIGAAQYAGQAMSEPVVEDGDTQEQIETPRDTKQDTGAVTYSPGEIVGIRDQATGEVSNLEVVEQVNEKMVVVKLPDGEQVMAGVNDVFKIEQPIEPRGSISKALQAATEKTGERPEIRTREGNAFRTEQNALTAIKNRRLTGYAPKQVEDGYVLAPIEQIAQQPQAIEPQVVEPQVVEPTAPAPLMPVDQEIKSQPVTGFDLNQQRAGQPADGAPVLQNRDRSRMESVEQMQSIAANPDWFGLGISNTMQDGAPVVFGNNDMLPDNAIIGDTDIVIDGNRDRYESTYAVIEAEDLITSHDVQGNALTDYVEGLDKKVRAIAGNGRAAGLREAYRLGTTDDYKRKLYENAGKVGISQEAIQSLKNPVLVRVTKQGAMPENIGDLSNISMGAELSQLEQAKTDAKRLDINAFEYDDEGVTNQSVQRWVRSLPVVEKSRMVDDGKITKAAVDRLTAAILQQTYENDDITTEALISTDEVSRNILRAVVSTAPLFAKLKGKGDFDIRGAVSDAVGMALNAARKKETLADYLKTIGIGENPEAVVVAQMFAENNRSAKKIAEKLTSLADSFNNAVNIFETEQVQDNLFGEAPVKSRDQLLKEWKDGEYQPAQQQAQVSDEQPASAVNDERDGRQSRQEGRADSEGDGENFTLEQPTEESLAQAEQAQVEAEQAEQAAIEREQQQATADEFNLTGSDTYLDQAAAEGQADMLGALEQPEATETKTEQAVEAPQEAEVKAQESSQPPVSESQLVQDEQQGDKSKNKLKDRSVYKTLSGRETTVMPTMNVKNGIVDDTQIKNWLFDNAESEAISKGDTVAASRFKNLWANRSSSDDVSAASQYLFGRKNWTDIGGLEVDGKTGLTLSKSGKPYATEKSARRSDAFKDTPNAEIVPVEGGFAVREGDTKKEKAAKEKQAETPQQTQAEKERIRERRESKAKSKTNQEAKPSKPAERIEDFGEKIEGAKKFTYTGYRDQLSSDVDIESLPLSKSFPKPNAEKLIADGADPVAVAFMLMVRSEVPTKPRKAGALSQWVKNVEIVRTLAQQVMDDGISQVESVAIKTKNDVVKNIVEAAKLAANIPVNNKSFDYLANMRYEEVFYTNFQGEQNVNKVAVRDRSVKSYYGARTHYDTIEQAKEAIIEQATMAAEKMPVSSKRRVDFGVYIRRNGADAGKPYIGKKAGKNVVKLSDYFASSKEAQTYLQENYGEVLAKWDAKKVTPAERRAFNEERIGADHRNGLDVTPQMFAEAFGFRGVQFGNYVEQDLRQADLNNAYDALMDLAQIIGLPAQAMSLNGTLGLAFGARGKGGKSPAKAHYEIDEVVINLTKDKGAGSLAHEWFHALDNYFAKIEDKDLMGSADYMTAGVRRSRAYSREEGRQKTADDYKVRNAVYEAFKDVQRAVTIETEVLKRSARLDETRSKDYWQTVEEMTARSFERYVIGKLNEKGYSNDYLANILNEKEWQAIEDSIDRYPYPLDSEMDAVNKAYDNLFNTIDSKDGVDNKIVLFSRGSQKQEDDGVKNLYVSHNLTADNLIHADKMGGLPVPSLAIARSDIGFESFGEISLIADSDLLTDSDAKTFNADIYSPRYPTVSYDINYDKFNKILGNAIDVAKKYDLSITDPSELERGGVRELKESYVAKIAFLIKEGRMPRVRHETYQDGNTLPAKWMKFVGKGYTEKQLADDAEFKAEFDKISAAFTWSVTKKDEAMLRLVGQIVNYVEPKTKKRISSIENGKAINAAITKTRKIEEKYNDFVSQIASEVVESERIFNGFTNSGTRRYLPHNLDTVVKLLRKELRGGEGFNYGVGTIRSGAAKQFKSVSQIQKSRDSIIPSDDMALIKEEISSEFDNLAEDLRPYYKYDQNSFQYMGEVAESLYEMARGKGLQDFEGVPADVMASARDFVEKLTHLPTEYFESKVQRAVDLSEFKYAVMPKDTPQSAKDVAKKNGLTVRLYDSKVEGDRARVINGLKDILFSFANESGNSTVDPDKLRQLIKPIVSKWDNPPAIFIVSDLSDSRVPERIRLENDMQLARGATGQPRGVFYDNKVYLVTDGLKNEYEAVETLLHESLGHYGLRGVFGNKLDSVLTQIVAARRSQVAKKAKDYGFSMANRDERLKAAEEVLAEMAQSNPKIGFVLRAIAAIRTWLRENVPAFKNLSVTDSEIIRNFIMPAREFVIAGEPIPTGSTRPRLMVNPTEQYQAEINQPVAHRGVQPADERIDSPMMIDNDNGAGSPAWELAKAKGLDMSKEARLERARAMGFDTDTVYYHGTGDYFEEFNKSTIGKNYRESEGGGFFFTKKKSSAANYAELSGGDRVIKSYLKIQNPYTVEVDSDFVSPADRYDMNSAWIGNEARLLGHDSILIKGTRNDDLVVVFEPNQIRSVDAAFDPDQADSANIMFSRTDQRDELPEFGAETTGQMLIRTQLDEMNRFKELQDWMETNGIKVDVDSNVHWAENRYHGIVANKQEDFREQVIKPLFKKMAKAKVSDTELAEYMHARHAPERNAALERFGVEAGAGGMTTDEANKIVARYEKRKPGIKAIAEEWQNITNMTKDMMLSEGLITKEIYDNMLSTYDFYVPLKGEAVAPTTGKGMSATVNLKRALGHGKRDEMILENIQQAHEMAIMNIEKNRVGQHLLALAVDLGRDDIIGVGNPQKRAVLQDAPSYVVYTDKGLALNSFETREQAETYVAQINQMANMKGQQLAPNDLAIVKTYEPTMRYMAKPMLEPHEINVFVNGFAVRMQLNDELLANAYNRIGDEGMNFIGRAGRTLNTYLSAIYTGYSPEFIFVNAIRDVEAAFPNITGEKGAKFASQMVKNYPVALKMLGHYATPQKFKSLTAYDKSEAKKWVDLYREYGSTTGAAYLSDMERLGKDARDAYDTYAGVLSNARRGQLGRGIRLAGMKYLKATFRFIERANMVAENAARLATFKTAVENGIDPKEAAILAKNVTTNFNRKGSIGKHINAFWLFHNAAIQGTRIVFRAALTSPHRKQVWAVLGAFASAGFVLGMLQGGGDDEEYDKLPDHVKIRNLFWRNEDDTGWILIPFSYGYGFVYGAGRLVAETYNGNIDPKKAGLHLASLFMSEFSVFGNWLNPDEPNSEHLSLLFPTGIKIVNQPITNISDFHSPIYPEARDRVTPDSELMWRGTVGTPWASIAKDLNRVTGGDDVTSGLIDVSPEVMKYYWRTFTGGLGTALTDSYSGIVLKTQGVELDNREKPIVRKFVRDDNVSDARRFFYEESKDIVEAAERYNKRRKSTDLSVWDSQPAIENELAAMINLYRSATKEANYWRDQVEEVRLNKDMPVNEKRALIKQYEQEETRVYDFYVDLIRDGKSEVKLRNRNERN